MGKSHRSFSLSNELWTLVAHFAVCDEKSLSLMTPRQCAIIFDYIQMNWSITSQAAGPPRDQTVNSAWWILETTNDWDSRISSIFSNDRRIDGSWTGFHWPESITRFRFTPLEILINSEESFACNDDVVGHGLAWPFMWSSRFHFFFRWPPIAISATTVPRDIQQNKQNFAPLFQSLAQGIPRTWRKSRAP